MVDSVRALIAEIATCQAQLSQLPGISTPSVDGQRDLFDELVTDGGLRSATESLFHTGHYREAVLQGYVYLNNFVKDRSRLSALDGRDLMLKALSANNPKLAFTDLKSRSKKDEQQGYMEIFAGAMTGIRNPRAHETRWPEDERSALELLSLAQHLLSKAQSTVVKRVRRRGKATP